jgi:hypothetical protein
VVQLERGETNISVINLFKVASTLRVKAWEFVEIRGQVVLRFSRLCTVKVHLREVNNQPVYLILVFILATIFVPSEVSSV